MQSTPKRPVRTGLNASKSGSSTPPGRRPFGPRLETFDLIERIVALEHKQVALEVLADAVLSPFLDVFGTGIGALLLYHAHDGTLTLAASRGLSATGQQHLEELRPGAASAWEIPLHGLLNRKAYVIERPHEHPFVPELVAKDRKIANLASIPLYRGGTPVGVLLVIAERRPVSEPEIFQHILAYDVLALALDTGLRARAGHLAPAAPAAETAGGDLVCEQWQDPLEASRRLERALETSEHERENLVYRLSALESRFNDTVAELEKERANAAATIAARVAESEERLERERTALEQQLSAAHSATDEQLAMARATTARELATVQETLNAELASARDAAARELADVREVAGRELSGARTAAEKSIAELRAALASREVALAEKISTLAKREATLAEQGRAMVAIGEERDRARQAAVEAGDNVRKLHGELEALRLELEAARKLHGDTQAESAQRARRGETLAADLAAAQAELAELNDARERLAEALGDDGDAVAAVHALQTRVAALERETEALSDARTEHEKRAAAEVQAAEHKLATQRREFEEAEAAHRRQVAELVAAQRRELDAARTAHERELESARAAHERGRAAERAAAERSVATVRGEAETAIQASRDVAERVAAELEEARAAIATLREERAAIRGSLEDPTSDPAEAIATLRTRQASLQNEFAALHARATELEQSLATVTRREEQGRAAHRQELTARETAEREGREALEKRHQSTLETMRGEHRTAVESAQAATEQALARAGTAEKDNENLRAELGRVRAEAARLREDRERVLAAIDDPSSEPAAVIRALRDEVGSLEAQLAGLAQQVTDLTSARADLEARTAAESRAAEQRHSAARSELEEARRRDKEQAEAAQRREREEIEAAYRRALEEAASAHERATGDLTATHQRDLAERQAAHQAQMATAEAASADATARATAARREAEALAAELERLRGEAARLREERDKVVAAVEDPSAEPATVIRALRAEVASLEGRLDAAGAEHAELERRAASDAQAVEERTAIHRREAEELRAAHERELADVRAAHQREIETARLAAERAESARLAAMAEQTELAERLAVTEHERDVLAAARQTAEAEQARWASEAARTADAGQGTHWVVETVEASETPEAVEAPSRPGGAASPTATAPAAPTPKPETPTAQAAGAETPPLLQAGVHRIFERDSELRDEIAVAIASDLGDAPAPGLVVANVLAALPDRLDDLSPATLGGSIVAGYGADSEGRSRLLGAIRWFGAPPTPEEAVSALEQVRGVRRIVTLSDDVDAFIPAKTALTRAGHSVSMACDTKQALDLLAMVSPQAVLVDLRAAPDAVAHFLDALELEKGEILSMLVLGEGSGRVLKRVVERLLRPRRVDPAEIVTMSRAILVGPPAPAKAGAQPPRPLRPVERAVTPPQPAPRKFLSRRGAPKRR